MVFFKSLSLKYSESDEFMFLPVAFQQIIADYTYCKIIDKLKEIKDKAKIKVTTSHIIR